MLIQGTYLVKNSQKYAYVIYERPLIIIMSNKGINICLLKSKPCSSVDTPNPETENPLYVFCLYILIFKLKYVLNRSKPTTNFVKYLKYMQDSYIQDWVLYIINKLQSYFKRYKRWELKSPQSPF